PWSAGAVPIEIVLGLQGAWGFHEFYVADLDAIQFDRPHWPVYESLLATGVRLLLDAGVRDVQSAQELFDRGVDRLVVALETLDSPELLDAFVQKFGPEHIVFSLDLMQSRPIAKGEWQQLSPLEIAERVIDAGVSTLIVLDLAGVGIGEGIPTLPLCREIHKRWPNVSLITGGGVRNATDVVAALHTGVQSVLVASALHDGRLTSELLRKS
ncbi:MAG: HisA/HisF-related TIM barrel protein, partial [Thermomicrobiales bacterium]